MTGRSAAALFMPALLLVACSHWPAFKPREHLLPDNDLQPMWSSDANGINRPDRWWRVFDSPELESLMNRAFEGNLDVARAWTRLRQARARADIASADKNVMLDGAASGSRSRSRAETRNPMGGTTVQRTSAERYDLGLAASYEVDLWGRIEAASNAAALDVAASRQDIEATALTLSGRIAEAWLRLKAAQAERALLDEQIQTSTEQLELLQLRQRRALSAAVDVLQQQQQVAGLQSDVTPLEQTIALQRLEIARLLGLPAGVDLDLAGDALPPPAELPDAGVPADLLENRPDIHAAWARLEASEWDLSAAKADRLPALRLTASQTYGAASISNLLDNWTANLAAGLTAPILDGGRLAARRRLAEALADELFVTYRDTVLGAIKEVEDALARANHQSEYLRRLEKEADVAAQTLAETQRRYRSGLSDYLPVLTALSARQRVDRSLVNARLNVLLAQAALCRSLGGDWTRELSEPPAAGPTGVKEISVDE